MSELENKEAVELNPEEMEEATGGQRSFKKRPDKAGFEQYKVLASDTLISIAKKFGISDWRKIRDWNPHIDHKTNMIRTGEWLWIKK